MWLGDDHVRQMLVKWRGKDEDEAMRVEESELVGQFPDLRLEDKTLFEGEEL